MILKRQLLGKFSKAEFEIKWRITAHIYITLLAKLLEKTFISGDAEFLFSGSNLMNIESIPRWL